MIFTWIAAALGLASKADKSITVQKVIEGIDNINFADQEKAGHYIKVANLQLKHVEQSLNENSIRSITRRVLAVAIVFTFLALIWGAAVIWYWNPKYSLWLFGLAKSKPMSFATGSVIVFYFGYYGVMKVVEGMKGRRKVEEKTD